MVTLDQIAAELGVSKSAVSYVLAGKAREKRISRQMADRIKRVADRLNYVPNMAARSLQEGRTRTIGVVLRNAADRPLHSPANMEVVLGVNLFLERAGYVVCLVRVDDLQNNTAPNCRVFHERMLDGLIVLDDMPANVHEHISQLSPHCVYVHTSSFGPQRYVREDELAAGRMIGREVIRRGYRRVVWAGPKPRAHCHYSVTDRYAGLAEAIESSGIPLDLMVCPSQAAVETQLRDMRRLIVEQTAVVANSADTATRVNVLAARLRLVPGVDFGLAACDDWEITRLSWPELTRVGRDLLGMGRTAAQMLVNLIEKPAAECPSMQWQGHWIEGDTLNGPPR